MEESPVFDDWIAAGSEYRVKVVAADGATASMTGRAHSPGT